MRKARKVEAMGAILAAAIVLMVAMAVSSYASDATSGASSGSTASASGASSTASASSASSTALVSGTSSASSTASSGSASDVATLYPDEYNSYHQTGYNRSHANMAADLDTGSEVKFMSFCVACKSSDYNAMYEKYGAALFDSTSSVFTVDGMTQDLQDTLAEMYDCTTCHEDEPGSAIGSRISFFNDLSGDFGASLAPGEAVCGQCHNALAAWCEVPGFDQTSYSPYRYGIDADAILKASKEDGAKSWTDDATGIVTYKGNHAIVEMYQGSAHQSAGLTCIDCHMETSTDASGNEFTDHDASGMIMYSNLKLETCLNCHGDQDGIATTTDMFYWLRLKETELADAQGAAQTKVNNLYAAIFNAVSDPGTVDDDALAQAKDMYSTADFYLEWGSQTYISRNNQTADSRGTQAAHNFDGSVEYFNRAGEVADEALALLS